MVQQVSSKLYSHEVLCFQGEVLLFMQDNRALTTTSKLSEEGKEMEVFNQQFPELMEFNPRVWSSEMKQL